MVSSNYQLTRMHLRQSGGGALYPIYDSGVGLSICQYRYSYSGRLTWDWTDGYVHDEAEHALIYLYGRDAG